MLADRTISYLLSERLHPVGDGNKCRDPQANIRSNYRSLLEEWEIELSKMEGSRHHKKTCTINKLGSIWVHRDSTTNQRT